MWTQQTDLVPQILDLWHRDYPKDVEPLALAGRYFQMLEDWDEAEKAYRSALSLEPENDDLRLSLGKALKSLLKTKDAISLFQDYLSRHPDDLEAIRGLANCYSTAGDLDGAIQMLRKAHQKYPEDFETQKLFGEMLFASGEPTAAVEVLERAHRAVEEDAGLAYQLAGALKACGRVSDAEPLFAFVSEARPYMDVKFKMEKELLRQPRDLELRMKIAEITAKYISRRDAIRWYLTVLQLSPNFLPAHQSLAELYRQLGDEKLAEYHAKFTVEKTPKINSQSSLISP
jgi:tetratricopeptide (TPR) repeat protein